MKYKKLYLRSLLVLCLFLLAGCDAITDQSGSAITATGTVEAAEVTVASEISGRVTEVLVREGMSVTEGQALIRLENDVLEAEFRQAEAGYDATLAGLEASQAALNSAHSNRESAEIGLEMAKLQLDMVTKAAYLAERPLWDSSWDQEIPNEFDLPSWYFSKEEEIAALNSEIQAAAENLNVEKENLADTLLDISNADFVATEERLVRAQAAFLVVEELLDRQIEQNGREAIDDYLQSLYDSAEAELVSAQAEYDSMLSTDKAEEVLEARARVDVAHEMYLTALSLTYDLQTGGDSLEVTAAELAVHQAENIVAQAESVVAQSEAAVVVAEKTLGQAEATLDLMKIQIEKLTVVSPIDGVVLVSSYEAGELAQPGMGLLVLGKLDHLTITVYLSEDVYGRVNLGDTAKVSVDSFPGEEFEAEVIRIADKAEYTPRNVQTEEDRRTTVFAIELTVIEGKDKLKPGMPADVDFSP